MEYYSLNEKEREKLESVAILKKLRQISMYEMDFITEALKTTALVNYLSELNQKQLEQLFLSIKVEFNKLELKNEPSLKLSPLKIVSILQTIQK